MKYVPHSDEELNRMNLLSPGVHDFEVVETDDKPSKSGSDMITLKLHVFEEDGTPRIVFDYLGEFMPHKLKHAAQACGLEEEYNNGTLSHGLFLGRSGKCQIVTQPASGAYQEKSAVKDYIKRIPGEPVKEPRSVASDLDDNIPF